MRRPRITFPLTANDMGQIFSASNELTIRSWEERWIENIESNAALFTGSAIPKVNDIMNTVKRHRAIVVGAGPSLKRQGRYLKDVPSNWGIIACDHATYMLRELGVVPTLVITMDGEQRDEPHVQEGMKWAGSIGIPIVCDMVTCHSIVNMMRYPYFYRSATDPMARVMRFVEAANPDGIAQIGHGGNVGSLGLVFAKFFMFARHVILVGMECSLDGDDLYYHGGTCPPHQQILDVHDIYGRIVKTNGPMHNYKIWNEYFCHTNDDVEWINANDGGYLGVHSASHVYDHFNYLPLKDAIAYLKEHGEDD